MAVSPFNYLQAPITKSPYEGLGDIFKNYNQGKQDRLQMALQQALAPGQLELQQANINQANMPEMGALEKILQQQKIVEQRFGKDSPEAQQAMQWAQRQIEGAPGISFEVDPSSGAVSFSQGGSSSKGGGSRIVDGKLVSAPTGATSSEQQQTGLANVGRAEIAKFEQPYLGTGSHARLISDRLSYEKTKDPQAKREIGDRLVQSAVASMLAPEYAALQLSAQGVRPTVSALHHQFQAIKQGWPEGLELVVNNLPQDLQEKVKHEHARRLEEINQAKSQYAAQGFPIKLEDNKKEQQMNINDAIGRAAQGAPQNVGDWSNLSLEQLEQIAGQR